MKKLLLTLSLAILGCASPVQLIQGTPTPTLPPTETPAPTQTPLPTAEPGTEQNPLILALGPSPTPSEDMVSAGNVIAAFLESHTGYRIVSVAPPSETALVDALDKGNAHIASLSPYAYLMARENDSVTAVLARMRDGQGFYGAQFIANRKSGFTSYYDAARDVNTSGAFDALQQLRNKKPCWSDAASPSGYVVPLGLLNQSQITTGTGAFLEGQPSVVRAVYAENICDFGATFIDARQSPTLEADYGDVMERVVVLWRVPKIIPYENIVIANDLPVEMRRVLQRAFVDLILTPEGKSALQTVYGIDEIQIAEDAMYDEFASYVKASGLSLTDLIK
ncbi:MAG: PhnD/SsuA/transferrin family substrate-binding protein [Anaerolineales bacterium]|nr:PhnD/SsuA/transferrin family substrate-binding protein [Anaerolineales bacterium]MBP8165379.1 PhnD/SsuA/transferrin family substrate-binding protein [Anaerolineales bacterium]